MSLRDRILAADDIGSELVDIPEWDVKVELRTMTAGKRTEMMRAAMDDMGNVDTAKMWPMLIVAAAYDPETGEPIFTSEDMDAIADKSAAVIERLGQKAMDLSGMGGEAVDDAGKAS